MQIRIQGLSQINEFKPSCWYYQDRRWCIQWLSRINEFNPSCWYYRDRLWRIQWL